MKHHIDAGSAPTDRRAAGLEEYAGRTPEDAATTEVAVQNAVRTISELMREDRKRRVRDGLPDLALPEDLMKGPAARRARQRGARREHAPMQRLLAWRPGPTHGAWAAMFAAVLLWPRVVLIALFVMFVACLVGVALFGPDMLERLRDRVMQLARQGGESRAPRGTRGNADEDDMPEPDPDPFKRRLHDLRG